MTSAHPVPSAPRWRRSLVVVLSVLSVLLLALSSVGLWAGRTALNNDVFVDRVGSLASEPDVQNALAAYLTDEVLTVVDVEGYLQANLPPPADLLAIPLSAAVQGFVEDQVRKVLATEAFATVWERAVGAAHQAFVTVASGEAKNVTRDGDTLTVNLLPVIGEVLESMTGASPQLVERLTGTLEVLATKAPPEAIAALEQATSLTLPDDFGTITIDDGGALGAVRTIANLARTVVIGLLLGFVAATVGALWLSDRRFRTASQLLGAFAVVLALLHQLARWLEIELAAEVASVTNRNAVRAVVDSLTEGLVGLLARLLFVVISVAIGIWAWNRREVLAAQWERQRPESGDWWKVAAPGGLAVLVAAAATILLWWFGPGLVFTVLIVVAVLVAEAVLWRTSRRSPNDPGTSSDATAGTDTGVGVGSAG